MPVGDWYYCINGTLIACSSNLYPTTVITGVRAREKTFRNGTGVPPKHRNYNYEKQISGLDARGYRPAWLSILATHDRLREWILSILSTRVSRCEPYVSCLGTPRCLCRISSNMLLNRPIAGYFIEMIIDIDKWKYLVLSIGVTRSVCTACCVVRFCD
jgi:hypothetical protein